MRRDAGSLHRKRQLGAGGWAVGDNGGGLNFVFAGF